MSTPASTWSYTATPVLTQQAKYTNTNISAKRVEGAGVYQRHPLGASALLVPPGSVSAYAGINVPGGWLHCDGSAIDRTIYADLFESIGTTYGNGDGVTTFNIPNLRGRNVIGLNSSETDFDVLGETGGAKRHTLTISEMPAHTHSITDVTHAHTATDSGHRHGYVSQTGDQGTDNAFDSEIAADQTEYAQTTELGYANITVAPSFTGITGTNSTGGSQSHNILDPYMALRYIIKV
jgi:microcystin-dependent protein